MDETADEKSPADTVTARQYSGTVGGITLCHLALPLTYATGYIAAIASESAPTTA